MIKMLRVDDRLIHGQVALVWAKELGVNRIIVANDTIANDSLQVNVLKMAAPETVKTNVISIEKAINLLTDPRADKLKILVVINNMIDVERITSSITEKPFIDVANVGRVAGDIKSKVKLTDTVYLSDDEISASKTILASGHKMYNQPLPSDSKLDLEKLI